MGGNPFKAIMSKNTLKVAAGAVGGSVAAEFIINKWGTSLPGASTSPYAQTFYRAAIPLAAAYAVRKFDRDIAQGLIIGAAISVITDMVRYATTNVAALQGLGLAGELNGFAAAPSPARLDAIRRVKEARVRATQGFAGRVDQIPASSSSPWKGSAF